MSIDIQGLPGGLVQNAGDSMQTTGRSPAETVTLSQSRPPAGQSPDSVSLTDSATRMQQLESTLRSLPVVDAQRVEGVQRQLATGSYAVNPAESADKLLEMERNLP